MISQLTDIFLPHHHHHPLALIKADQGRKKNHEKPLCFDDFAILILTFFDYIATVGANVPSVISQPTVIVLPRCHHRLLAFIKPEWRQHREWLKQLGLDIFIVHSLTFFQVNC